jgi:hypothetical protein
VARVLRDVDDVVEVLEALDLGDWTPDPRSTP